MEEITFKILLLDTKKRKDKKEIRETEERILLSGETKEVVVSDINWIKEQMGEKLRPGFRIKEKKIGKVFREYIIRFQNHENFIMNSGMFELSNVLKLQLNEETLSEIRKKFLVVDEFGYQSISIKYDIENEDLINFVENNLGRCLEEDVAYA